MEFTNFSQPPPPRGGDDGAMGYFDFSFDGVGVWGLFGGVRRLLGDADKRCEKGRKKKIKDV